MTKNSVYARNNLSDKHHFSMPLSLKLTDPCRRCFLNSYIKEEDNTIAPK